MADMFFSMLSDRISGGVHYFNPQAMWHLIPTQDWYYYVVRQYWYHRRRIWCMIIPYDHTPYWDYHSYRTIWLYISTPCPLGMMPLGSASVIPFRHENFLGVPQKLIWVGDLANRVWQNERATEPSDTQGFRVFNPEIYCIAFSHLLERGSYRH